ncbi:MAG: 2-dehydro-3-deoxygalactonokinase [Ginsengibacter sp.]
MGINKYFLSVDWGTSNFRLRMVACPSQKIVDEVVSENGGVKNLFYQWKKDGGSRRLIFLNFLKDQIKKIKVEKPVNIAVVISGMASSSLGLLELPYAELPFATNGANAIVNCLKPNGVLQSPVYLISGIKSETDVIRGEETQLLGCVKDNEERSGDQLYIFPGTHSKHILVKGHQVIDFKTYMTGEIFGLLATKSVLGNSVKTGARQIRIKSKGSFEKGLNAAIDGNILNEAFRIRTNDLFKKISKEDNFYYLSGLMIGTEVKNVFGKNYEQILVVSGPSTYSYYKMAFQILGMSDNIKIFSPSESERFVVKGQYKILKNNIHII